MRTRHYLIVDGYNIIGAWPELRDLKTSDFGKARDLLIEYMAEYQGSTGYQIIVVFDAHLSPGIEKKITDERIERLVGELKAIDTRIYVATSDSTEQWQIFGKGALRKSARELKNEMDEVQKMIHVSVGERKRRQSSSSIHLSDEIAEIFERWRRGQK
ncbi:NYN domain-containing protein [Fictibacillus phosphorivorans]|uniref:NYN domain-containing protein n=1 Tax=Fictibacillus phosphorivorans TaxID=1221500 RepID=UPI00203D813E|nr:NYN domain-containing protein [Fictibacillus phosphorivorans]MCM3719734.1 NYN domain-containing protein [Fictibacillus phosphorivorans]MCM3777468.1 NYN domain-containing protein [Fictibacillus phosphorivorans]